jgi:predicted ATP-grasp superfamily ATP-dependent carboligase
MLDAVVTDLAEIPGINLRVPRDDRLDLGRLRRTGMEPVPVSARHGYQPVWQELLASCDAAWPIAPETGGILERLCRQVTEAGKGLLNSGPNTVRLATQKQATLEHLGRLGIPVVPSYRWGETPAHLPFPRVIKPDDGAGCEGLRLFRSPAQWPEAAPSTTIVQPYLEGEPLSLSALFCNGECRLLSCNRQRLTETGDGLKLAGCRVNSIADPDGRWQSLADAVARALPGLWGYAGIDLIATAEGPHILEINPRLTTSYAGLRQAIGVNPAAMVLQLLENGQLPAAIGQPGRQVDVILEPDHDD